MSELMKTQTTGSLTEITVTVPSDDAGEMCRVIEGILALARIRMGASPRKTNEHGDELYEIEEVFPDSAPGHRLRGLRKREGLTQKAMAEALGIRQSHLSDMERGTRAISVDMAKRIAKTYGTSHQIFL